MCCLSWYGKYFPLFVHGWLLRTLWYAWKEKEKKKQKKCEKEEKERGEGRRRNRRNSLTEMEKVVEEEEKEKEKEKEEGFGVVVKSLLMLMPTQTREDMIWYQWALDTTATGLEYVHGLLHWKNVSTSWSIVIGTIHFSFFFN